MPLKRLLAKVGLWSDEPEHPLPDPDGPFPEAWRDILRRRVWIYERLDDDGRERLERWVLGFLWNIPFEGCSGLEITDEMRVTVAGWASLLVLNREGAKYPYLHRILIYPDGYRISEGGFFFPEQDTGFDAAGESWEEGYVILSWRDVIGPDETDEADEALKEQAEIPPTDENGTPEGEPFAVGYNVVLHELAHQLDLESGEVDGNPVLGSVERKRWDRVLERDFARFLKALEEGRGSAIDDYGAEDPVEFFAVATETFFENPLALQQELPDLYELLEDFYGFELVEPS